MEKTRKIPKTWGHDRELTAEGYGSHNSKEYCKCEKCKELRIRRDSIYKNGIFYRFVRWINCL